MFYTHMWTSSSSLTLIKWNSYADDMDENVYERSTEEAGTAAPVQPLHKPLTHSYTSWKSLSAPLH